MSKKKPTFPVKDFKIPGMTKAKLRRIQRAVRKHFEMRD